MKETSTTTNGRLRSTVRIAAWWLMLAAFHLQTPVVSGYVSSPSLNSFEQQEQKLASETDHGSDVDMSLPTCKTVRVTAKSASLFFRRLSRKNANFAFMTVVSQNDSRITWSKDPDVLFKTVWIWTTNDEGGAFPYVWYAHDFYSLSLGLLDKRTAHRIRLNLTTDSPTPCRLQIGERNSTQTIANAFNEMMQPSYKDHEPYKNSVFCYTVKYNNYGTVMTYITHLLGIEKGYTGYRCCFQHADNVDKDNVTTRSTCQNRIQSMTKWYCILYSIAFLLLFYCPFMFVPFAARLSVSDSFPDDSSTEGYESFPCEQSIQVEIERTTRCKRGHRWIYLGVDKPITLFKILCKPFYRFHAHPVIASKVQRYLVLILTPSVIGLQLFMYRKSITQEFWIQRRLQNDIPVGFLSVPFGFQASKRNWMGLFGGPYVMYSVYFTAGLVVLLLPRSISHLITSFLKREAGNPSTLLSIDLLTIEKWGTFTFCHLRGYHLISKVLKANFYILLNKKFWRFAKSMATERAKTINRSLNHCFRGNRCAQVLLVLVKVLVFVAYFLLCIIEIMLCFSYYGLPAVFLSVCTLRGYVSWTKRVVQGTVPRLLLGMFVSLVTLHSLIAFAVLFICSTLYLAQVIDYTYIGIIIYPEYTVGYVIGAGTLIYYLVGNIRRFNDKFSNLLAMTVDASSALEKRREQRFCKLEGNTIVLSTECAKDVEMLTTQSGEKIQLTDGQKIALQKNPQTSTPFIKWRDNQPGIPYQLFRFVMRRFCPLHVEVFWFLFRLTVFCLIVVSIITLLTSYNINSNLALPAQMITAISLNVLPRALQLCVSSLDVKLKEEHRKLCLEAAVSEYWGQEHIVPV